MAKRRVESQIGSLTLITKSQELIILTSLHASGLHHTVGKLLMKVTTLLKPHFNWRFEHKIMDPQSRESPNLGNFETPTWES